MIDKKDIQEQFNKLFGEDMFYKAFPELALSEAILDLTALVNIILVILEKKGVITKEESKALFSEKALELMKNTLKENAKESEVN